MTGGVEQRRFRRRLSALVAVALVAGTAALGVGLSTPSVAAPSPGVWDGGGLYPSTVLSDGTAGSPKFAYDKDVATTPFDSGSIVWQFSTIAATTGQVTMPYTYEGFHAFFQVRVQLQGFVRRNGVLTATTIVSDGPADCCTPPSSGFRYSGSYTFDVLAGDEYGFLMGGSNFDSNNTLRGTLTLNTGAVYADPATVASNTSWPNALDLRSGAATGANAFRLTQPGEARWYKFPVVPNSKVSVDLAGLARDYDLALYRDISQAFTTLTTAKDLTLLGAEFAGDVFSPAVNSPQIYSPQIYSPQIYSPQIYSPQIYSPQIYSPQIYSPQIYSPQIYSPQIYSPQIYSPQIYSPQIYSPQIYSPSDTFLQAFSSAQTRSLIAVSANDGALAEHIDAPTWNNTGWYYVKVQGRNGSSGPEPFTLTVPAVTDGPCVGAVLDPRANDASPGGVSGAAETVIVTDTGRLGLDAAGTSAFTSKLQQLAARTRGVVVDVAGNTRVRNLNAQADTYVACPYAKTLVASAIRDVIDTFRDTAGTLKYVVLAGGDSVIPFFRYADDSGLGPESDFVPPVTDTSASQASLRWNNVLGQDAYGALDSLDLKGGTLPVPDLAVGRLVETPAEITGMIDAYLGLNAGTLPRAQRSLVTGYDFLTSAADSVQADFVAGMGAGTVNATLVTDQGVPTTTVTGPGGPSRSASWTATDLANALTAGHHDLVFLAGHFSANGALAADYSTSIDTSLLEANPGLLTNSLVFSAGCHSGYNLVDGHAVPVLSNPLDWAQAMARQKATFIGGTGYQYADTDFLAYSALLYAGFAGQLRAGTAGTPVAVGAALVKAKREYLAEHGTLTALDRKSLLQATLFGLPMTGIDLPGRAQPVATPAPVSTSPVLANTPGAVLGLQTATVSVATPTTVQTKPALDVNGAPTGLQFRWLTGSDGVQTAPAIPALPLQFVEATSASGDVLRGVGFRGADYADTAGVTPLTGAPTIEQNNIHTTFGSPVFFPQKLWSVNYFDALGGAGATGRTRLAVTPAQYRAEPGTATTERRYDNVGVALYYSSNVATYGGSTPALAAPPSISQVSGRIDATGTAVDVEARITGDPSAGIQQVWITYTAESGSFHTHWRSLDLVQDPFDSTRWTGRLALPADQPAGAVRFLVQAVNGVGLVSLDNNLGDGYTPSGSVSLIGTPDRTPTAGWFTGPVTVAWKGSELGFEFAPDSSVATTTVSTDGAGQTVTSPTICGPFGGCGTGSVRVSIDSTAPSARFVNLLPALNTAGWANAPVTATFSCADALSGVVAGTCGPVTLQGETSGQVVSVTARDNAGNAAPAVSSGTIRIDRTVPTVAPPAIDPLPVGTSGTLTVAASDTRSGVAGGEYFVGTDPGVGRATAMTAATGSITARLTAGSVPGVYPMGVRSRDAAGNWSATATGFLVVYDPNGGFATGGGWFTAPVGSYPAKPAASFKTKFGFEVRYKKGISLPVGETEIELDLSPELEIESTSYQWLVVTGAQAQFRGVGRVEKSTQTVDFLVTVVDGRVNGTGVDRIRVKVTDRTTGALVFDTNPGAPDGAAPTLAIGKGNLLVKA